jgi:hypothetical protein
MTTSLYLLLEEIGQAYDDAIDGTTGRAREHANIRASLATGLAWRSLEAGAADMSVISITYSAFHEEVQYLAHKRSETDQIHLAIEAGKIRRTRGDYLIRQSLQREHKAAFRIQAIQTIQIQLGLDVTPWEPSWKA